MLKTLAKRLSRVEAKLAQRTAAREAFPAKQILFQKIESLAARLAAAGYSFPESGAEVDAVRLYIKQGICCAPRHQT